MAKGRTLGGIFVDLILRDEKFRARMRTAAKFVNLQTARMRKGLNDFANSNLTKLTGVLGAAGLGAVLYRTAQGIDKIAKSADRVGTTTQRFQAAAMAAKVYGIEQDKVADILKDVNDRVGDFLETGGGPMKDFFENVAPKVGVTAQQFRNLSSDQALGLYIDTLKKAGLNQQEMTFYLEAMASDATALIPVFENGAIAIDEMGRRAELFGLALDRVDSAKVEAATLAMQDLANINEGFWKQITVKVAPLISELGERVVAVIERMGGMGKVAETVFNFVIKIAGQAGNVFRGWELIIAGLNVAWQGMKVVVTAVIGGIMTYTQTMLNLGITVINKFIEYYNKLPLEKKMEAMEKFTFAGLDATVDATKSAAGELATAKEDFWKVVDKGLPSDTLPEKIGEINMKWEAVAEGVAEAAEESAKFGEKTDRAADLAERKLDKVAKKVKEVKTSFMSFSEIAEKGGRSANARLAQRAVALREKAEKAEAAGNFSQADSLRNQAEGLESRVKRREFTEGGGAVVMGGIPKDESPDEKRARERREEDDRRRTATPAERAKMAAEERSKRLGLEAGQTPAPNTAPAETEAKSKEGKTEAGLLEKLDNLISLLTDLPKTLGVA